MAQVNDKIPMAQNVTKDSTYFPVPQQLIRDKTEAITRRMIQDKNRELPFYSDPIYRPPPRPPKIYNQIVWKISQALGPK